MKQPPPGRDSRVHARKPVVRQGIIVHDLSGATFRCTIVDVSLGGARLQLIAPDLPAGDLTLVDRHTGTSHGLRIAWRAGALMGAAFTSSAELPAS